MTRAQCQLSSNFCTMQSNKREAVTATSLDHDEQRLEGVWPRFCSRPHTFIKCTWQTTERRSSRKAWTIIRNGLTPLGVPSCILLGGTTQADHPQGWDLSM